MEVIVEIIKDLGQFAIPLVVWLAIAILVFFLITSAWLVRLAGEHTSGVLEEIFTGTYYDFYDLWEKRWLRSLTMIQAGISTLIGLLGTVFGLRGSLDNVSDSASFGSSLKIALTTTEVAIPCAILSIITLTVAPGIFRKAMKEDREKERLRNLDDKMQLIEYEAERIAYYIGKELATNEATMLPPALPKKQTRKKKRIKDINTYDLPRIVKER